MKDKDGNYQNYTLSISDEANGYGQNVAMWKEQNKEERDSKKPRTYVGNGKVVWTDGTIKVAEKKQAETPKPQPKKAFYTDDDYDVPF